MKIAVEGCAHGELEKIYETILDIEKAENIKIDVLLCCGDFQATRNLEDMQTMAVPDKYKDMCTFYKYYSGERVAPILTIFIGGNHEASNHLQELPYGGWVAPNIYYLGYAGVVRLNGIRIGGISGIYKSHDYLRGRFEYCPYSESTKKSVYHVRQLEVFRLNQLSNDMDIFISHDWPQGIYNYGNKAQLLRFKPFLREDMENDRLGSKPCEELLKKLQPNYWFSAHLHCKFAALVDHREQDDMDNMEEERITKFLALDKCLPKRRFLQVLDIESEHTDGEISFEYDLEWLTILYLTNHLINIKSQYYYLPGRGSAAEEKHMFTPNEEELQHIREKLHCDLRIPKNFVRTVEPYDPMNVSEMPVIQPKSFINPQTTQFCDLLGIDDPLSLAMMLSGHELSYSSAYDTSSDIQLNESSLLIDGHSLNSSSCADSSMSQMSPLKRKSSLSLNLPMPKTNNLNIIDLNKSLNPDELNLDLNSDDDSQMEDVQQSTHNSETADKTELSNKTDTVHKLTNLEEVNLERDTADERINEDIKGNNLDNSSAKIMKTDILNLKQADNEDEIKTLSEDISLEKTTHSEVGYHKTKQNDLGVLPVKKFKRRNMNLYKADSEEES
ncbi:lariat debranching enzyme [Teleopsis dalmanni]|uniref:lariat debranching enzyme n=1 Tax=Teleopsis dalmanni TaxID=139649 RepID=UPI0018CEFB5B|nr:lariat debranching enzyme [Teleopsis dalmanni]